MELLTVAEATQSKRKTFVSANICHVGLFNFLFLILPTNMKPVPFQKRKAQA